MSIQKVSDITAEHIAEHCKLNYDDLDQDQQRHLEECLKAAKAYIKSWTYYDDEELDKYYEFVMLVFWISQNYYDNPALIVNGLQLNPMAQSILELHQPVYDFEADEEKKDEE